jgi:DNA repair ATPase RecN
MAEETNSSVRITNAQVYEKLIEVSNVQIEMVVELRGLKYLPSKVADIENRLSKVELIARLVYGVYGATLGAVAVGLVSLLNG